MLIISSCGKKPPDETNYEIKPDTVLIADTSNTVRIMLMGDLFFGESYQEKLRQNVLEMYGYRYSFANISPLMKECNYRIANLETPISSFDKEQVIHRRKKYIHYNDTLLTPKYLSYLRIDAVSLANNHILDLGEEGLFKTYHFLEDYGIFHFGSGKDIHDASIPLGVRVVTGKQNRNVYVLGMFEDRYIYRRPLHWYADDDKAGVSPIDIDLIKQEVKTIKANDKDAYIILFPHWGKNYKWSDRKQRRMAKRMIDAGANMIIGHGAHRMQEIEVYNEKLILYGIGNSVFNSPGRFYKIKGISFSLLTILEIHENKMMLKCYPIESDNRKTNYQPHFLNIETVNGLLEKLKTETSKKRFPSITVKGDEFGAYFEIEA